MHAKPLVLGCLLAGFALACGGRSESNPKTYATAGNDSGGDVGNAGSGASAGTSGSASAGTAGTGASADVCELQQQDYAEQRDQIIAEFADVACTTPKNCIAVYDPSNCSLDCSYLVVTAAGRGVVDRLVILGQRVCPGDCPSRAPVNCPSPPVPECIQGKCRVTSLK
jgi:hypothetical protein